MKQAVRILMIFFVFVVATMNVGHAKVYPKYLDDNQNLFLVYGHMGTAYYADRSSLVVEKDEPPQYILAVKLVEVQFPDRRNSEGYFYREDAVVTQTIPFRFFYNYDLHEMYIDDNHNDNWVYIPSHFRSNMTRMFTIERPAGEIAFALAYNSTFYGNEIDMSYGFYPEGVSVDKKYGLVDK